MNIFGWKSAGRGYLRPAKTHVQQDRLPGLRGYALGSLGEWPRHYEAQMREGYLSNVHSFPTRRSSDHRKSVV